MESKNNTEIYTCPHCGSRNFLETDYEAIKGKDGNAYQYYACVCTECKRKYYNVARYIGALTAGQLNELSADTIFSDCPDDDEKETLERYERAARTLKAERAERTINARKNEW